MRKMEKIHLTQFAKHGGCAAKIGPDTLGKVLGRLPKFHETTCLSVLKLRMTRPYISFRTIRQ